MFKIVAIVLLILIALPLVIAATKPGHFRVERTTRIAAPAARIFPLINDFHNWSSWSPYERLDPSMKRTFSAAAGSGSVYHWNGNGKAGEGRMEITDASPRRIGIDLEFTRPFRARNVSEFLMQPDGDSTTVTWAVDGPKPYPMKVMALFVDMDKLMGKDFESGLANLRSLSEHEG